jgi:hypothetical protein
MRNALWFLLGNLWPLTCDVCRATHHFTHHVTYRRPNAAQDLSHRILDVHTPLSTTPLLIPTALLHYATPLPTPLHTPFLHIFSGKACRSRERIDKARKVCCCSRSRVPLARSFWSQINGPCLFTPPTQPNYQLWFSEMGFIDLTLRL